MIINIYSNGMDTLLRIESVSKSFNGRQVLSGYSLELGSGDCVALYGANGSGKSTLLKVLGGVLVPDSGSIWCSGGGVWVHLDSFRNFYPRLTLMQNIDFFASLFPAFPADSALSYVRAFGLEPIAHNQFQTFSAGERLKSLLVISFLSGASVLCFDEPFKGLDQGSGERVRNALREYCAVPGHAILFSTHEPSAWAVRNVPVVPEDVDRQET